MKVYCVIGPFLGIFPSVILLTLMALLRVMFKVEETENEKSEVIFNRSHLDSVPAF